MNFAQQPTQWSWSQEGRGILYFLNRSVAPRICFAPSSRQSLTIPRYPRSGAGTLFLPTTERMDNNGAQIIRKDFYQ